MRFSDTRRTSELDRIAAAQSLETLWKVFEREVRRFGFPFYIYLFRHGNGRLVSRTNMSNEFYGNPADDPFLVYCCDNLGITFTGPDYAPRYGYLRPGEKAFIARANRSGMQCGLGIPVRTRRRPEYGGFNLGCRLDRKSFEEGPALHAERLRALCFLMQERLEELPDAEPAQSQSHATNALSEREREVFAMLGTGLSRPQMSERLGISPHTVDSHVKTIYRKLGIRSQAEAIRQFLGTT